MKKNEKNSLSGPMIVPARYFFDLKKEQPASIILGYQMKEWEYILSKMNRVKEIRPERIDVIAFRIPELTPNGPEVIAMSVCRSTDPNVACVAVYEWGAPGERTIRCDCYEFPPDDPEGEPKEVVDEDRKKQKRVMCHMELKKISFGDWTIPIFHCTGECPLPRTCTLEFSQTGNRYLIGCACLRRY